MNPSEIEALVRAAFPDATCQLVDLTGTQNHYELTVVSSSFVGQSSLERHRRVYTALGATVGTRIHALALKTLTPDQTGQ